MSPAICNNSNKSRLEGIFAVTISKELYSAKGNYSRRRDIRKSDSEAISFPHSLTLLLRRTLAARNAHEYDNVAEEAALAKCTSDSCMICPYSRLHAKSIYYEAEPRARAASP